MVFIIQEYKYEELLERAWSKLPDELKVTSRFEVPEPKVYVQGKQTFILNFKEIANAFQRDPKHILLYLSKELAAPAMLDDKRAIIQRELRKRHLFESWNSLAKRELENIIKAVRI